MNDICVLRRILTGLVIAGVLGTGLTGCVTPQSSRLYTDSVNDVLGDADRYFQQGNYHQAAVMYSSFVYTAVVEDERLDHAQYRLALSHYYQNQFSDTSSILRNLIERRPDLEQMDQVRDLLQRSEDQLDSIKLARQEQESSLQQQIARLEALIEAPNSTLTAADRANQYMNLGDLYWQAGLYKKSILQYQIAASIDASVLADDTLRQRVRIDDSGEFTLRDPIRIPDEPGEIYVRNADLEFVERENWLGETEFLRLTGEVYNAGLYDVRDVVVEGTIYDFYGTIQGTETVSMGRVRAGSARPFQMIFEDYTDTGFDIRDYRTTVYYESR